MDELSLILDVATSMPGYVTGAISIAAIVYTMWLRKRGVDINERTSLSQNQIAQMDALLRQNGDLQSRLIDMQNTMTDQTKIISNLSAKIEHLEAMVRRYQRQCDECPGPKGKP